jgi:hypothetical protein
MNTKTLKYDNAEVSVSRITSNNRPSMVGVRVDLQDGNRLEIEFTLSDFGSTVTGLTTLHNRATLTINPETLDNCTEQLIQVPIPENCESWKEFSEYVITNHVPEGWKLRSNFPDYGTPKGTTKGVILYKVSS